MASKSVIVTVIAFSRVVLVLFVDDNMVTVQKQDSKEIMLP